MAPSGEPSSSKQPSFQGQVGSLTSKTNRSLWRYRRSSKAALTSTMRTHTPSRVDRCRRREIRAPPIEPFPEPDREFGKLLDLLRPMSADQLREKLVVSGWLLEPYGEDQMRCQECMYYLVHKRWCDLPELSVPVEPNWWCRLWKI